MRVACPHCQARYNLDERKLPAGGAKVKCPKCQGTIVVRPPAAEDGAVALPAPGAQAPAGRGGAVPLPTPAPSPGGPPVLFHGAPAIAPGPPTLAPPAPPAPGAPATAPYDEIAREHD
jgi:predicted Zn finger-like uncharacterized protein